MTVKRMVNIICLGLLALTVVACSRGKPTADLSADRAKVECRHLDEAAQEVSVGQHESVDTGDEINTDENGLGILTFPDFLRVEVFRETGLQVKAAPDPEDLPIVKLYLALGTTVQELQERAEERVEVTTETDWATIRAVSTVYLVSVDDDKVTSIVVFYGEAEVEAQEQTVVVRTGQATYVEPHEAPRAPIDAEMGAVDDWLSATRRGEDMGSIKPFLFPPPTTPTPTSTPAATPTPTLTPTMVPTLTPTSTSTATPTPKPPDVRLTSELEISNLSPLVGESVKATFRVRNYGEQTFTAAKFLVKGRGPDDSIQDFRPMDNFSLAPGAEYTYSEYRTFSAPGEYWLTPHYSSDGANWLDITWPDGRTSYLYITVWTPVTPTSTPTNTPTPTPCVVQPPIGWQQYTVQRGDTLYSLAVSRGTTVEEVRPVNCLTPDGVLRVGQLLWLPPAPTPTSTSTPTDTPTPTNTPTVTPTTPSPLACVDFEDLPEEATYGVGDTFSTSGTVITVGPIFLPWDETWFDGGRARVSARYPQAGGSGKEMAINDANLDLDFGGPVPGLSLLFATDGTNHNIKVNGDFRDFGNFDDINGLTIGGVKVSVLGSHDDYRRSLVLTGTIDSFVIGGRYLWIDDVCPSVLF